jgi:hypothetical protein
MIPLLLAAAVSIRVALPAFEVDHAPGLLAQRLPEYYAAALSAAQCATPIAESQLGPQAKTDFGECGWQTGCSSDVGRVLGIDVVVLGHVKKVDTSYLLRLTVVDVRERRVRSHLEHQYNGKLSGLDASVKEQIASLCQAINPEWSASAVAEDALSKLPLEAAPEPTEAPKVVAPLPPTLSVETSPKPPPPTTAFDVLPPLPPGEEAVAPKTAPPSVSVMPTPTPPKAQATKVTPLPVAPASVATATEKPPAVTAKLVAPSRPLPWGVILGGGAVATAVIGLVLGAKSHAIWSGDQPMVVGGVSQHSITHPQAMQADGLARSANALFGVTAALGVGAGVAVYVQGGLGLGGRF